MDGRFLPPRLCSKEFFEPEFKRVVQPRKKFTKSNLCDQEGTCQNRTYVISAHVFSNGSGLCQGGQTRVAVGGQIRAGGYSIRAKKTLCESDPTKNEAGAEVLFYILIYSCTPEAQESAPGFWSLTCGDPWLCERSTARRKLLRKQKDGHREDGK